MGTIPSTADQITAGWFSEATGFDVSDIELEQIGIGVGITSAVYRAHLSGPDCPDSAIIKLPSLSEEAVFTATMLRMYIREVGFFEHLADQSPIAVPQGYYGVVDEETSEFVLIMEDMRDLRIVDQTVGMEIDDANRAVEELSTWSATWWGRTEDPEVVANTVSLADPIYPAVLPIVFAEGWELLNQTMKLSPSLVEVGERWIDTIPRLMPELAASAPTLIHGDYRADNMLFSDDGSVVLLDFQLIGTGTAAYDLAYLVTQSLDAEACSAHEKSLFERWRAGLVANGVPESTMGGLWDDYRKSALFCLGYPVITTRNMDLTDPRQIALLERMVEGYDRAADELAFTDLL